ncbi:MAG: DUF58 domain-containing protein [Candidatus Nanosalina sp.]
MSNSRVKSLIKRFGGGQDDADGSGSALSSDEIVKTVDAEVKRISEFFQFILKYNEQFQPSGVEFSGLRQYLVTDDASRIDWKHSAGSPDLYVKQYEEEKNMDTFILLDASATMQTGTAEKTKSEYASVVASTIAYASVDAGLDVGIGMYGESETIMSPQGGNSQYQKILREVTKEDHYGGKLDLEESLNNVIGKIKEDTVVFIISDFLEIEGDWKSTVRVASEKFRHVMGVMVRDLRDYKLPEDGALSLESPYYDEPITVQTNSIAEEFNEKAREQEKEIEDMIEGAGAGFLKVDTRDNFSAKFASYFDEEGEKW